MDIKKEDVIFTFIALVIFALFFFFLINYDSILPGLLILWTGITLFIIVYTYIYKRKNRDMRILKIRFLFIFPVYPVGLYYHYLINIGYDISIRESLLFYVFLLFLIILSSIVEYLYRKNNGISI
jgi:hypothetical protein